MEYKRNWIMRYFGMINGRAICMTCRETFLRFQGLEKFRIHTMNVHPAVWHSHIKDNDNWLHALWLHFFIISEDDEAKCRYCPITYSPINNSLQTIQKHLIHKHVVQHRNIGIDQWLTDNYQVRKTNASGRPITKRCIHGCGEKFIKNGLRKAILFRHLVFRHNIVPPATLKFSIDRKYRRGQREQIFVISKSTS